MRILAIGAHPDDIETGCGGTLLKYIADNHEVYLLVMTDGGLGGKPAVRKKEQLASSRLIKAKELIWGGYKDTQLFPNMNQLVYDIELLLGRIKPDVTFVNFEADTHQDHRALNRATVSATRYIKNVIFYECPTTQNFEPTVFVDIKDTLHDKIAALVAHQSQVQKTNIEGLSIKDIAYSTAVFRGIQGRVQFAEGFVPLRLFISL